MIVGFTDYVDKYNFSNVTGIIHVGAHHGQEHSEYRKYFGDHATIHWFEPVLESYEKLVENIGGLTNNFFYNFALGSQHTKKKIWKDSGNDGQSSSFLKPEHHLELFPHISFELGTDDIEIYKLDEFKIKNSNVLVLDTQGYELEVLKGSVETLPYIDHIFCEVNSGEMYSGCPSINDLDSHLRAFGFVLKENWWTPNNWGDCYWAKY